MRVLILEDNLMWSPRLARTVSSLGHEAIVLKSVPEHMPAAEVSIVNLGNPSLGSAEVVESLRAQGTKIIGHAGHKEKSLLQEGAEKGCDLVVTNSQLTFKLEQLLAQLFTS